MRTYRPNYGVLLQLGGLLQLEVSSEIKNNITFRGNIKFGGICPSLNVIITFRVDITLRGLTTCLCPFMYIPQIKIIDTAYQLDICYNSCYHVISLWLHILLFEYPFLLLTLQ